MSEQTTVNLPEAPAAATAKVKSPNGFEWMVTTRGFTTNEVLDRLPKLEEWLMSHNYTPAENSHRSSAANGTAPNCPTHNKPMKASKAGGWYCPVKVAEDDGTGKPVYCKQKSA